MDKLMTKWFSKWCKKTKITKSNLKDTIIALENNTSSSSLGSGLYKVRLSSQSKGKSGGFRTIIVYNKNDRVIFVFGHSKSEKDSLTKNELEYFKKFGHDLLKLTKGQIQKSIIEGLLIKLE